MAATAPDPTDEALAAQAAARTPAGKKAFDQLVGRYAVRVLVLLRTCGVGPDDSEDVAQVVWVRAWQKLPGWEPGHFRGWLFAIARNAAVDHHRRPRRARPADAEVIALVPAGGPAPDAAAEAGDDVRKLRGCLGRLSPEHRAVVAGHLAGARYEDLAADLGVEVGTVKSRLNRAREALKLCLGPDAP